MSRRIEPNVIGVVPEVDRADQFQIGSPIYHELATATVGNKQLIVRILDTLRFVQPAYRHHSLAKGKINDFDCIISKGRNEQAIPGGINGEVIDTSGNTQWDRFLEAEHARRIRHTQRWPTIVSASNEDDKRQKKLK